MEGLRSCNFGVDLKAKSFIPAHTSPLKCPVLFFISSVVAAWGQAGLWQEEKGSGMGAELGMRLLELEGADAHSSILALAPPEVLQGAAGIHGCDSRGWTALLH